MRRISVAVRRQDHFSDAVRGSLHPAWRSDDGRAKQARAAAVRARLAERRDVVGDNADAVAKDLEEAIFLIVSFISQSGPPHFAICLVRYPRPPGRRKLLRRR